MKPRIISIVLAGGKGTRMGSGKPKQFLRIKGKPVLAYSLGVFNKCAEISDIIVVCHKDFTSEAQKIVKKHGSDKVRVIVEGGRTRQMSAFRGLSLCPDDTDRVIIHDAARPFIDNKMVLRVLNALKKDKAVTTAVDVTDTVFDVRMGKVKSVPDRRYLKRVQTPQGFDYKLIKKAHEKAAVKGRLDATDDCSLVLAMKKTVRTVQGSKRNIKITTKDDLDRANNKRS